MQSEITQEQPPSLLRRTLESWKKTQSEHRTFIQLLLIACLIRVIVMPFFGHIDFLSEWRRIYHAWDTGYLFPGSRFITSLVEWIHFMIVAPLLAEKGSMFNTANWAETTASHLQYFGFLGHHAILRTFFLLKIPYLLFDLGTAVLLYRFFNERKLAIIAAAVWLFNPITFFASFIFARYEAIPLFFVAGSLLMLKEKRLIAASVFLGLAMWSREIVITLFPFFLVAIWRSSDYPTRSKILSLPILLLFIGFASNVVPNILGFPTFANDTGGTVNLVGVSQSLELLGFQVGWYFTFVFVYSILFLHLLFSADKSLDQLLRTLTVYYCAFFICAVHTVHYVSWGFVPFALLAANNRMFLKSLAVFCLVWIGFWSVGTDLGVFTHWLAMPSSHYWSNLPNIPAIIELVLLKNSAMTMHHVITAARSVYAAALVFCIVMALRSNINKSTHTA